MEQKKYSDEQNERDLKLEVALVIKEIKDKRKLAGGNLKRSPYTSLEERKLMNADFLMEEFNRIQEKKSKLPSGERRTIEQIVMYSFSRLMAKRNKEETKKKNG